MSEALEESPDITKSWVFVESAKIGTDEHDSSTSRVEDVKNIVQGSGDSHQDSDSDSISVISESGSSYKSDEEFASGKTIGEQGETVESQPESAEENLEHSDQVAEIVETVESPPSQIVEGNANIEKLIYFATSALCAVIIVGFSVAVQQYFQGKADIDSFNPDLDQQSDFSSFPYCVQSDKHNEYQPNKRGHIKKHYKKKHSLDKDVREPKNRILKIDEEIPPIAVDSSVDDNTERTENHHFQKSSRKKQWSDQNFQENLNEKYYKKRSKKFEKEILQDAANSDATYDEKLEKLKIKEQYLREKEQFLIKKEHNLLKRELKVHNQKNMNKQKEKHHDKNKYDKENHDYTHKKIVKEKKKVDKWNNEEDVKRKKHKSKEEKKNFPKNSKSKYRDDEKYMKKRNLTGQWYINMHKARNIIRQQEHASDWIFDRAHLRSLKRNKAHWYFQWMVDRERLRAK